MQIGYSRVRARNRLHLIQQMTSSANDRAVFYLNQELDQRNTKLYRPTLHFHTAWQNIFQVLLGSLFNCQVTVGSCDVITSLRCATPLPSDVLH